MPCEGALAMRESVTPWRGPTRLQG
jgi:hypothetical protein